MLTLLAIGTFVFKALVSFFVLGFMAMFFLWPSNEQPVAASNKVMMGVCSLGYLGWMFNFFTI